VSGAHLGPVFFFLQISFRQLRVCYLVAPSLTRGRVCNLFVQLLLGLARAVTLGSKSRKTYSHILLSHLRLLQPGGPGSLIYIPQEQGGPVIPPGTGFPFYRLLRLAGLRWMELEFFLRPTVSRPVSLGVRPPFGTLDQSLFCSSFVGQLRCSAFIASSLTRKRVCNLLLNCFLAWPEQSHFSRSPTQLTAIFYCLI
jgi:hypothetical protein